MSISREIVMLAVKALCLTGLVFSLLTLVLAEVRTSPSYQLESDSLNFGGGAGASANYSLQDTLGEIATGYSSSAGYNLHAGFQQLRESFISLTAPSTVNLLPALGGISGGVSNGSSTVTVLTDSPSGYQLSIEVENSPAMQKTATSTIADYVPASYPASDFGFSATPAGQAYLAFTVSGNDAFSRFLNNGTACGVGSASTPETCWDGLSTTSKLIAIGSANQPNGEETKLYFRVGIGVDAMVESGEYIATTTITALPI